MFRTIVKLANTQNNRRLYTAPAYSVARTINKGIPVYATNKLGGTRLETVIRKVQGDSNALMKDLLTDFPDAQVKVNSRTQNVVMKGHHVNELKEWLIRKGF